MTNETSVVRAPLATQWVAPDVLGLRVMIANLFLVGQPGQPGWVLVDAGVGDCSRQIVEAAEQRFGAGARPAAIVLTHGHFDHIGALPRLLERWDVPVYAHALELPYLSGRSDYPPPDPTVGGGAMAWLSFAFPRRGIDLGNAVRALPADGSVPPMPGWQAIHTPGHAPGHISLFRMSDRVLIAGDAIVTTRQESAMAVLGQTPALHRPPAYFTIDWGAARRSAQLLAALSPSVIASGHGPPLRSDQARADLNRLADNFDQVAVPPRGRYVGTPALADENGIISVPPAPRLPTSAIAAALFAGAALFSAWRRSRRPRFPQPRRDQFRQPSYPQRRGRVIYG